MRYTPDALATARRAQGLTQEALARTLGVHSVQVSRWERGVSRPQLRFHRVLADMFDLTFVDGDENGEAA